VSLITYETKNFRDTSMEVIEEAKRICREYAAQGIRMTLRTLYYQYIARDTFPESWRDPVAGTKNTQANYKKLSKLVSDARIGGLLDWNWIEDSGRTSRGGDYGYDDVTEAVLSLPSGYSITHWDGQAHLFEVMFEKDALTEIIAQPCRNWRVTYTACKGSPSTSLMKETADRLRWKAQAEGVQDVTLLYLGDHDPTGLDISRDIERRLKLYRCPDKVQLKRIALNLDQIQEFSPPPSPAKETDSRYQAYVDRFGVTDTWELDALEPRLMRSLVEDEILAGLNRDLWDARVAREEDDLVVLRAIADNWDDVRRLMVDDGLLADDEEDDDRE
jgi:hypothetical protein